MSDDSGSVIQYTGGGGDDPGAPIQQAAPVANQPSPAVLGLGYYNTGAQTSPVATQFMNTLNNAAASGKYQVGQPIGPGGADPTTGLPYSWLPYDPNQQLFDPHQHFGPTYNDPVLGKLQAMYTEPSKSANDFWHKELGPTLFGLGLSAITAGAGSSLLAPLFKAAISYGTTGSINPLGAALSFLPSGVGAVDPSLLPYLSAAGNAYSASKGNYIPGAISLAKLAGGP